MENQVILKANHISKSFNGVKALDDVKIELKKGEVHALCGENGAGKSTLLKIITGIYSKNSGDIYIEDKKIEIKDVQTAKKYGIYVVPQEMQMLEELSVAENIFIGEYPMTKVGLIDWKKMFTKAEEVKQKLGKHGEKIDVHAKTGTLGMADWQLIEIMRGLIHDNIKVLAFDEPTASLSENEVKVLFKLIGKFRDQGIAIAYVSHRMKEIFEICDEISIYRDGKYIGTKKVDEVTEKNLITMMIGRNLNLFGDKKDRKSISEKVVFEIKNFSSGKTYQNISFALKKGEILGIYGLVGAGRTELMRGIFGLDQKDSGETWINGEKFLINNPKEAKRLGLGFVTESRREEGLMLRVSLKWNLSMTNLKKIKNKFNFLDLKKEVKYAKKGMEIFNVKATGTDMKAGGLSGGNQQKIILAKWIMANCDILIVDEPTRGIDVGAKAEVYKVLKKLATEGKSIIMVSSELPEVIGVSDRVIVMCEGKMTAEMDNVNLKEEDIIKHAFVL